MGKKSLIRAYRALKHSDCGAKQINRSIAKAGKRSGARRKDLGRHGDLSKSDGYRP